MACGGEVHAFYKFDMVRPDMGKKIENYLKSTFYNCKKN
jgi:hypothetical protein